MWWLIPFIIGVALGWLIGVVLTWGGVREAMRLYREADARLARAKELNLRNLQRMENAFRAMGHKEMPR
jgi:hypothetical protein